MTDGKCRRFTDTEAETTLMALFLVQKRARFTVGPCEPKGAHNGDTSEFEFGLRHAKAFDDKLRFNLCTKSFRAE